MEEVTIFHKFISGELPCHKVWEDENFLAFLSIFPNTEGVTVVVPKHYQPSYFAAVPDDALSALVLAAKKVARLLDEKLPDVGRTALVFEGYGVNYLHAKLFPMHGTIDQAFKPIESKEMADVVYDRYPGYISSHDAKEADGQFLSALAAYLRGDRPDYPVRSR
jgi:diadenosine tetraphosphate (Ap4A) HIT family hydrolase